VDRRNGLVPSLAQLNTYLGTLDKTLALARDYLANAPSHIATRLRPELLVAANRHP
jgi:hypothetical protein